MKIIFFLAPMANRPCLYLCLDPIPGEVECYEAGHLGHGAGVEVHWRHHQLRFKLRMKQKREHGVWITGRDFIPIYIHSKIMVFIGWKKIIYFQTFGLQKLEIAKEIIHEHQPLLYENIFFTYPMCWIFWWNQECSFCFVFLSWVPISATSAPLIFKLH